MSNKIPEGFVVENGQVVMSDEQMDKAFKYATEQEIVKAKLLGQPIGLWDSDGGRAYILYPDGRREYV